MSGAEEFLLHAATKSLPVAVTVQRGKTERTFVGVPSRDASNPLVYVLQTGKRGRPPRVHVDDVVFAGEAETGR